MYKVNFINKNIIEIVHQGYVNYMIDMSKVSIVVFDENYGVHIVIPSVSNIDLKCDTREDAIKLYNDISSALILLNADETKNDVINS